VLVAGALALLAGQFLGAGDSTEDLTYTEFLDRVEAGQVQQVTIRADGTVTGELEGDQAFTSDVPVAVEDTELLDQLQAQDVDVDAAPEPTPGIFMTLVVNLLPFLLLGGLVWFFLSKARGGGGMNPLSSMGKSKAKLTDAERPPTRFDDVAGYDGVKQEVAEVVDYLRDPAKYKALGAKGPGGVMLAGPPGTGKTLLARALAGEAEVPFLSAAGSEFVEMLVGVGASRVRDLFEKAREVAPAIIFIDELDSLGRKRGGSNTIGANNEQEQTLNQLLAEMDGFDPSTGIVVLAATNRAEMLDEALTRPGRFDRRIDMGPPSLRDRQAILELHARGKALADDVDLGRVARATTRFTGAELENLLNEAALIAVREERKQITDADLDAARDRLVLGRRDESVVLTVDEQRRVAVHEAGHAILAATNDEADPVSRVSILNSGKALGVTHLLPHTERRLMPEGRLRARMDVAMGGRAAELVVLKEASSGAQNDLMQATRIATTMVRDLGLSDRLGPVGYTDPSQQNVPPAMRNRPFSEDTQRALDEEVAALLRGAEERALDTLREYRSALDELVERLLEEETVDGDLVYDLVGREVPRPPEMAGGDEGDAEDDAEDAHDDGEEQDLAEPEEPAVAGGTGVEVLEDTGDGHLPATEDEA